MRADQVKTVYRLASLQRVHQITIIIQWSSSLISLIPELGITYSRVLSFSPRRADSRSSPQRGLFPGVVHVRRALHMRQLDLLDRRLPPRRMPIVPLHLVVAVVGQKARVRRVRREQ